METLFIGGFPLHLDEIEIVKLFVPYGQVDTIKIVRDKKTGKCKGYAFVVMPDRFSAEEAVYNLNGMIIGDREITVNITEDQPKKPAPVKSTFTNIPSKASYVKVQPSLQEAKKKRPRRSSLN